MLKTIIVLPDGTELFSGTDTVNAIKSATITECVNDSDNISLGSVCASLLEASIIAPNGGLSIAAGDEVKVYKADEDGNRHLIGLFTLEKPSRPSANVLAITAYDRISWLDKDLTTWLSGLNAWPYKLFDLASMVCDACGLSLVNEEIPNGDFLVQEFSVDGVTGRQLMRWIGQAAGLFCHATAAGLVEFAWYLENTALSIAPEEKDGSIFYYQNGLHFEDYQTAAIEKVQIRSNADDVGTIYPDTAEDVNTYIIEANPLLIATNAETLLPIAQTLYERLQGITYTPCNISIPATLDIRAGDIIGITDRNGRSITAYIMTWTMSGQKVALESTGDYILASTGAVNKQEFKALAGKVLNLRTDVDGIFAENRDAAGRVSLLQQTVDGITSRVADQQGQLSQIQQNANSVSIQVKNILENGVSRVETNTGYTFEDGGMSIQRSDSEIANRIDHTGVYVTKSDETVLQANNRGVVAVDVTVKNYLEIGHARFEEYTKGTDSARTACYWI